MASTGVKAGAGGTLLATGQAITVGSVALTVAAGAAGFAVGFTVASAIIHGARHALRGDASLSRAREE